MREGTRCVLLSAEKRTVKSILLKTARCRRRRFCVLRPFFLFFAHMCYNALRRYPAEFKVTSHGLRPVTFGGDKESIGAMKLVLVDVWN